jgi:hypothetical protein
MKIDGACHCGHISYEAKIDPEQVEICHCTDCRKLSGSAFRIVVPAKEKDFQLLSGTPKFYVKTAESGAKRVQAFCPECGTSIFATAAGVGPKVYGIRLGTARQCDRLAPKRQFWRRSALPWIDDLRSLAKNETE